MKTIKGNYIYEFSKANKPISAVKLNENFVVETLDCYGGNLKSESDLRSDFPNLKINPATGPIFVENVKKGDTLAIEIREISLNDCGVMATGPDVGLLGDYITETQTKILPIEENHAILNGKVKIPVNKMIGVIGVAPEHTPVRSSTPGEHGGNMDTKAITEGNTLYLPVFQDGGLLAMGDLHAAMGDGELDGTGIEIGGKVTLRVRKEETIQLSTPIVETDTHFMVIASAEQFREAVRKGMLEAASLLQHNRNLEFSDAYRLLSASGDLRVSQLVNPKVTIRIALPKTVLKSM